MSNPFVAEIRLFPGNFAPVGWALCNGQLLPINQNTALFSLLGTTYGGDGITTFALPNFQGSAPLQAGQGPGLSSYDLGQTGGEAAVTLLPSEMPAHTHSVLCNNGSGDLNTPTNNTWCKSHTGKTPLNMYAATGNAAMSAGAISPAGGGQPHNNMPPYLVLNFIIALQGVYPSRQ
ncbi:MAG TPA: tail fiber protein [Verrucomicrobiae bacterium]|nr:tail fiber protein [Verrucomicrobiae bacterium]